LLPVQAHKEETRDDHEQGDQKVNVTIFNDIHIALL